MNPILGNTFEETGKRSDWRIGIGYSQTSWQHECTSSSDGLKRRFISKVEPRGLRQRGDEMAEAAGYFRSADEKSQNRPTSEEELPATAPGEAAVAQAGQMLKRHWALGDQVGGWPRVKRHTGWLDAEVVDIDANNGQHLLVFREGGKEWANLSELAAARKATLYSIDGERLPEDRRRWFFRRRASSSASDGDKTDSPKKVASLWECAPGQELPGPCWQRVKRTFEAIEETRANLPEGPARDFLVEVRRGGVDDNRHEIFCWQRGNDNPLRSTQDLKALAGIDNKS